MNLFPRPDQLKQLLLLLLDPVEATELTLMSSQKELKGVLAWMFPAPPAIPMRGKLLVDGVSWSFRTIIYLKTWDWISNLAR